MRMMKEIRILITDPGLLDDDDLEDIKDRLNGEIKKYVDPHDYVIAIWDVG